MMKKILIITTKWVAGKQIGTPCHTKNLISSVASVYKDTDVNYEVRYICKEDIWSPEQLKKVLLETEFDIALVSPIKNIVIDIETAQKLGKKLFIIVWDTHSLSTKIRYINMRIFLKAKADLGIVKYDPSLYDLSKFCNILVVDTGYGEMLPNIYCIFEPMDDSVLYPIPEEEKVYDISFIGSTDIAERMWYLEQFKKHNLPVTFLGGRGDKDQKLSFEEWAECHRKSKIELNFNGNAFMGNRKSRVYEIAACGNMMIATLPDVYKFKNLCWFEEGVHYDSMDEHNCVDKVRYYLANPEKRIQMANAMNEHFLNNYTPLHWWQDIFKWSKQ